VTHRHAERGTRAASARTESAASWPRHRRARRLSSGRRRRAHRRRIVKAQRADTLAERGCRAIDLIGQDDAGRHPRGVRGADLLQGECWFALEDDVEGNANLAPALLINRPRLGQVEPRGEGQAGGLIGDRQADQDLAVVDLAHLTAILPCHADRVLALLGHAAFVDDPEAQRPVRLHRWQDLRAHRRQHRLVAPRPLGHEVQQRLVHRAGARRGKPGGHRLHALAPLRQQQAGAVVTQRLFPASVVQRCGKGVEIRLECRLVFGRQGMLIHPLHMGATGRPHRLLHSINSGENYPIGLVEQQD
jgi:hypothetical protein